MYLKSGTKIGKRRRIAPVILVLAIILIIATIGSFMLGRYMIRLSDIFGVFGKEIFGLNTTFQDKSETVLINVRTPRILAAIFIGAALSAAGASYQGLFRNPMVSPDLLGASAGAGFGAVIALLFNMSQIQVQLLAFVFGVAAVAVTFIISAKVSRGDSSTLSLVLTGLVVSALFQAFITIVKYVADPNSKLPTITYWLMGGLTTVSLDNLLLLLVPIIIGMVPMLLLKYKLNLLAFGDEEARAIGVDAKKLRMLYIVAATLVTSASVASSGMIGWIGLVIPHLARMIVGPNYKVMLPVAVLLGAIFMLLIDNVSRCLFSVEIPLSVLTALFGAPFFLGLLMKGKKGWV
jgi:iron complex transport system permease protein